MKPSNTGIDWWDKINMSGHGEPESSAFTACFGKELEQSEFESICEWAAQIYRKEAKAEWQRELAAKVRKSERYHVDPELIYHEPPHTIWKDTNGDFVRVDDVLALINENEDAE